MFTGGRVEKSELNQDYLRIFLELIQLFSDIYNKFFFYLCTNLMIHGQPAKHILYLFGFTGC